MYNVEHEGQPQTSWMSRRDAKRQRGTFPVASPRSLLAQTEEGPWHDSRRESSTINLHHRMVKHPHVFSAPTTPLFTTISQCTEVFISRSRMLSG
jgi:hypothetical protein